MRALPNLTVSAVLIAIGAAMYLRTSSDTGMFSLVLIAGSFFYLGVLLVFVRHFWPHIYVLRVLKWIFSDLSFPRSERWLPWWGAILMIASAGRVVSLRIPVKLNINYVKD